MKEVVTGTAIETWVLFDMVEGELPVVVEVVEEVVVAEWLVLLAIMEVMAAKWWWSADLWASSWALEATS